MKVTKNGKTTQIGYNNKLFFWTVAKNNNNICQFLWMSRIIPRQIILYFKMFCKVHQKWQLIGPSKDNLPEKNERYWRIYSLFKQEKSFLFLARYSILGLFFLVEMSICYIIRGQSWSIISKVNRFRKQFVEKYT